MIHNIEEKQKLYERQSSVSGILSEEELARLIEQVEEREMLHAPVHIRENVFAQISMQKQRAKKLQLFSYRAKVLVGMAAALTVLFLVPVEGIGGAGVPQTGIFGQISWKEQEETDEIEKEVLNRQKQIDQACQRYQEEQEKESNREIYFTGIENRIRSFKERIFQ